MSQKDLIELIRSISIHQGVNNELCLAIAGRETELINSKTRYEENWTYLVNPGKYALALGITEKTETMLQKTSFTALQIMASCTREMGFQGYLNDLTFPEVGLLFAIKKLGALCKKYPIETDVISSWNQGSPRKENNLYLNHDYVDNVTTRLQRLRA
jgi:hypothetical protein